MNKIVIISAHPDDETLGCGGTALRLKQQGASVTWLNATSILESHGFDEIKVAKREREISTVAKAYCFDSVYHLNYPTMNLNNAIFNTLINDISNIFNIVKPDSIFCLNRSDAHSDHRILFEAVMACTKTFRYPYIKSVLMYECLSETEFAPQLQESMFIPNYFVDISAFLERKIEIMKIYESELGEHPFPRSIENIRALATIRGAMAGVRYAEAFQVIKMIT